MGFSIEHKATGTIDEVEVKLTAALKSAGFGILTRTEVDKVLLEKIGEKVAPYRILGACNPQIAHQALQAEPAIGVFLPCSICLRQEEHNIVSIWALDPAAVVNAVDNAELIPHGAKAQEMIEKAVKSV